MSYDINELLKKPELYKETSIPFWDDEHISKQMLQAHLNPEYEGAFQKRRIGVVKRVTSRQRKAQAVGNADF